MSNSNQINFNARGDIKQFKVNCRPLLSEIKSLEDFINILNWAEKTVKFHDINIIDYLLKSRWSYLPAEENVDISRLLLHYGKIKEYRYLMKKYPQLKDRRSQCYLREGFLFLEKIDQKLKDAIENRQLISDLVAGLTILENPYQTFEVNSKYSYTYSNNLQEICINKAIAIIENRLSLIASKSVEEQAILSKELFATISVNKIDMTVALKKIPIINLPLRKSLLKLLFKHVSATYVFNDGTTPLSRAIVRGEPLEIEILYEKFNEEMQKLTPEKQFTQFLILRKSLRDKKELPLILNRIINDVATGIVNSMEVLLLETTKGLAPIDTALTTFLNRTIEKPTKKSSIFDWLRQRNRTAPKTYAMEYVLFRKNAETPINIALMHKLSTLVTPTSVLAKLQEIGRAYLNYYPSWSPFHSHQAFAARLNSLNMSEKSLSASFSNTLELYKKCRSSSMKEKLGEVLGAYFGYDVTCEYTQQQISEFDTKLTAFEKASAPLSYVEATKENVLNAPSPPTYLEAVNNAQTSFTDPVALNPFLEPINTEIVKESTQTKTLDERLDDLLPAGTPMSDATREFKLQGLLAKHTEPLHSSQTNSSALQASEGTLNSEINDLLIYEMTTYSTTPKNIPTTEQNKQQFTEPHDMFNTQNAKISESSHPDTMLVKENEFQASGLVALASISNDTFGSKTLNEKYSNENLVKIKKEEAKETKAVQATPVMQNETSLNQNETSLNINDNLCFFPPCPSTRLETFSAETLYDTNSSENIHSTKTLC